MYGYVRPVKGELKLRDYELYQQSYCGLCHALKKRGGLAARFVVNYDFTFLAMLLSKRTSPELCKSFCPTHPLKKRKCIVPDVSVYLAADESIILAYWKLDDGIHDHNILQGLRYRLAQGLIKPAYKKAAAAMPEFSQWVSRMLGELSQLENANCESLDAAADKFAQILSYAASCEPDMKRRRILEQLLYHTGRIIYILDAADDLADDIARSNYNPLCYRFSLQGTELSPEQKQALRETLAQSQHDIAAAFELLEKNIYYDILANIIFYGLPWKTEAVLSGTKKKENGAKSL